MKRIAALTMLRNDEFFLRKWVKYYGDQLGLENLYVFFDGLDQVIPDFCEGVHTMAVEHVPCSVHEGDRRRIDFLSEQAKHLFESYDLIIGTDVDEFLVVDPQLGISLPEFLSQVQTSCPSISGLGIDVGQNLREESVIDAKRSFLSQRRYAKLSTRYSKASVLCAPVAWGSGFHRTRKGNFHIVKDLYLFHFGCVDLERIKAKMGDGGLVAEGWSKHLAKRAGTIKLVSEKRAFSWEKAVPIARRIQNVVRPPYAWNKPAMFEAKVVVQIPERFKDTI